MKKAPVLTSSILIAALLLSSLSGCGKNGGGSVRETAGEAIATSDVTTRTIRVATTFTGDDPYKNIWQQVLKDFSAEHPEISVVDEATSAG
jgi:ABC-type glycerol-3-phosphate transport system substrate-binding protein